MHAAVFIHDAVIRGFRHPRRAGLVVAVGCLLPDGAFRVIVEIFQSAAALPPKMLVPELMGAEYTIDVRLTESKVDREPA